MSARRHYTEAEILNAARLRHGPTVTRGVLAVLADLADDIRFRCVVESDGFVCGGAVGPDGVCRACGETYSSGEA